MRYLTMAAVACAGLAASAASADVITFGGDVAQSAELTGCNFFAELEWVYDGGSNGTLTLDLTNTTPGSVGGFLTGVLFNIDSADGAATASLFSTTDPDFLNTGPDSGAPFGMFDAGASLGGSWLGGGTPSAGIAIGATETFVWKVTAVDANALAAADFSLEGSSAYNFLARFRGLGDGRSDKVPVPTPGSFALLSLGALAGLRRRR